MKKIIDTNNFTLKMVWDHMKSKWFYYPEDINFQELSERIVIHEIKIISGIIIIDTFDRNSIGELFKKYYAHLQLDTKQYWFY